MKINELKSSINRIVNSNDHIPLMIWSPPGLGKSSAVRQIAQDNGLEFIDLRLSLLNPVDLRGLPLVNRETHKAEWLPPDFLPNGKNGKKGILFLDEINLAPQSVMSAGYQLILDRKLGSYTLPEGWKILAAGNRAEDQANVTKFPAPLANRFIHIDLESDDKEWIKWAIGAGVSEQIISFIAKMPQHLFKMPKSGEKSFPTPRSWENASKLHNIGLDIDPAVGEGVSAEFRAFCKVYEKFPNIDDIFLGKEKRVPKENDVLYALSIALIMRVELEKDHIKNIDHLFDYIDKFPKEFQVLTILNMANRSKQFSIVLAHEKRFLQWADENKDMIDAGADE